MNRFIFVFILISFITFTFLNCSDSSTRVDTNGNDRNGSSPDDFSHTLSPGSSNEAFIADRAYDHLIVEIQFMPGAEPQAESVENLRDFLELHLDKSSITILDPQEIPSGGQSTYSANDVRSLEDQHRKQFTKEATLASYVLFVDGEFDSRNVLGIAYFNTSTAYFADTINRISGGVGQPSQTAIESTVFNHEFGHLMGLVNNGTEMQHNHHDSDNGAHCTVEECLMYYSVNTTDFFANLFGGTIPELDEFCVADIESLK